MLGFKFQVSYIHRHNALCKAYRNQVFLSFLCCIITGFVLFFRRCTSVLGYLPQELLGTSIYEYYHQEDIDMLSQIHKKRKFAS